MVNQISHTIEAKAELSTLEELRRRERELADFVENASVGLHWVGPDGTILWANQAELDLLGYTREEYIGHHIAEFHADKDIIDDILVRLTGKQTLHNYEAQLRCKDGTFRYVLINSNVMWEGDTFVHTRCFTRDVTERKQAEESLKLYGLVLESMIEGVSVSDEQGFIIYTNPAEDAMFGYGRGELIGQHVTIYNSYPAAENERIVGEVIEHLKTKGSWSGEFSNRKKDGTSFPTLARITALEMSGKRHWVCVHEDITERKRAEEAIIRSEQRLALSQEAGNIGTFDWDIISNEVTWTAKLESLFGLPPGGFGGTFENWRERMHPEDLRRCEAEIQEALTSKSPSWHSEYRMFRADTGEMRWIDARAHIFYAAHGQPLRMIGINIDITDRKQAEEERGD